MLTEQALEARRAYRREWAARNKDKVKAAQERHWEKVAAMAGNKKQQEEPLPAQTEVRPA